jgi:HPt (histidine-containing phosphotransfer) domain-containing protein
VTGPVDEPLGGDAGLAGTEGLEEAVARLARRARQRNAERARRVAQLLAPGGPMPDPAARREAALLCHTVTGSAGTFGDTDLADAARRLERALRDGGRDDVAAALERFRAATTDTPPA